MKRGFYFSWKFYLPTALGLIFTTSLVVASPIYWGTPTARPISKADDIVILNWNVHKFTDARAFLHLEKIAQNSDIIFFQETVFDQSVMDLLDSKLHRFWIGALSFVNQFNLFGTGVATGIKYAVTKSLPVLSKEVEPILGTPKTILFNWIPIKDSSEQLLVINIHALNFVTTKKFVSQLDQLEMELSKHLGPVILAGDFNTYTKQRFKILLALTKRQGMSLTVISNDHRRLVLDHIFVRGLVVNSAYLLYEVDSSDHTPIKANLRFR